MGTTFKKENNSNGISSVPRNVQEMMEGIRSNFFSSMQDYIPMEVGKKRRKRKK